MVVYHEVRIRWGWESVCDEWGWDVVLPCSDEGRRWGEGRMVGVGTDTRYTGVGEVVHGHVLAGGGYMIYCKLNNNS